MTEYTSKSASERREIRDNNAIYQQLFQMSDTIHEDMAMMMCGGAIGGNMTGSQVIEAVKEQAGIEMTREDLKEIVSGTSVFDNSALVKNIEI